MNIILHDEELTLLPQKAIYIKKEKALLIADIHLGKGGHFRSAGIAVPSYLAFADLEILDELLNDPRLDVKRLILLGDLFHAEKNIDWIIFEKWREARSKIQIQLIKGNHDILGDANYRNIDIEVCETALLNNFLLVHNYNDEENIDGYYKMCGHVHPAVRIHGKARQSLTLPCFYFGESYGILPAFGRFTGKYIISPNENDCVFVVAGSEDEKRVIKI
ncbi:MAG: ligase-associated DNA damage response endonuclease PdeM [Bacteroidota bacterium]|nr:ligase-associated DNA damage response endonuclease PdeM [Bacteroidota bacterium]